MPIQALQVLERKIERQIRLFELKNRALGRKLERKLATQKERIGQKFDAHKLRIEQTFDAFADRKLALVPVPLNVLRASAFARLCHSLAQFADELLHSISVGLEGGVRRVDLGFEREHHQPQPSVL